MNNRLIYYFVVASLIFHLLALVALRHVPWRQALENIKEPIAIDLIGSPKHGKQTAIPKFPEKAPNDRPRVVDAEPVKEKPKEPLMTARAQPQAIPTPPPAQRIAPPAPAMQPQTPSPMPQAQTPPDTTLPGRPAESGGELPAARTGGQTGPAQAVPPSSLPPSQPSAPATSGPGAAPRRLVQPTVEDLMRYAKVDKNVKRVEPDQGITLDTEDLMYTSYLQGLKRRIEMVWKYPDTAQKDGLSGELVMRFSIARSGRVEQIELLKSSGYHILDKAAEQALLDSSPFNPLPDSWHKERFVITGTFVYKLYGLYIR